MKYVIENISLIPEARIEIYLEIAEQNRATFHAQCIIDTLIE